MVKLGHIGGDVFFRREQWIEPEQVGVGNMRHLGHVRPLIKNPWVEFSVSCFSARKNPSFVFNLEKKKFGFAVEKKSLARNKKSESFAGPSSLSHLRPSQLTWTGDRRYTPDWFRPIVGRILTSGHIYLLGVNASAQLLHPNQSPISTLLSMHSHLWII